MEYRGFLYPTSEHAYQAAKFLDPKLREKVRALRSAHEALKFTRQSEIKKDIRSNWQEVKLQIMEEILRAKLSQHKYVQRKLLESGDREIIKDSPRDEFWGRGENWDGANHLGKLWMKLRAELEPAPEAPRD